MAEQMEAPELFPEELNNINKFMEKARQCQTVSSLADAWDRAAKKLGVPHVGRAEASSIAYL